MELVNTNMEKVKQRISDALFTGEKKLREIVSVGGDAHYFEDTMTEAQVKVALDSRRPLEVVPALKYLLALLSKGVDVSNFFPEVVKNVVGHSVEVKKLVYMFLVHYADYNMTCREMALLSVNSFQNDLKTGNQLIRGLALRVLSSIRLKDIVSIQLYSIRACVDDSSPYVRRIAATAICKVHGTGLSSPEDTEKLLTRLLLDNSTLVLGSAVVAFNEVFPQRFDLIHPIFRKLCFLLADLDEWTQMSVLECCTRYARQHFAKPVSAAAPTSSRGKSRQKKHRSGERGRKNMGGAALDLADRTVRVPYTDSPGKYVPYTDAVPPSGRPSSSQRPSTRSHLDLERGGAPPSFPSSSSSRAKDPNSIEGFYSSDEDDEGVGGAGGTGPGQSNGPVFVASGEGVQMESDHGNVMGVHMHGESRVEGDHDEEEEDEDDDGSQSDPNGAIFSDSDPDADLDEDHRLLLKSALPLLKSRNAGVVLAVCKLYFYCGFHCPRRNAQVGKSLVRILRSSREVQYVALSVILELARVSPAAFRPFITDFFVAAQDPIFTCTLKTHILAAIADVSSLHIVLIEYEAYIKSASPAFLLEILDALAHAAHISNRALRDCIDGVFSLLLSSLLATEAVVNKACETLQQLIPLVKDADYRRENVRRLVRVFVVDGHPRFPFCEGVSSIVWLVGQSLDLIEPAVPDVLRLLAKSFTRQHRSTRMQILNLALRVSGHVGKLTTPAPALVLLAEYVLEMARYDTNTDLRDRARFVMGAAGYAVEGDGSVVIPGSGWAEVNAFCNARAKDMSHTRRRHRTSLHAIELSAVGSLSALVGHRVRGYEPIPSWTDHPGRGKEERRKGGASDFYDGDGKRGGEMDGYVASRPAAYVDLSDSSGASRDRRGGKDNDDGSDDDSSYLSATGSEGGSDEEEEDDDDDDSEVDSDSSDEGTGGRSKWAVHRDGAGVKSSVTLGRNVMRIQQRPPILSLAAAKAAAMASGNKQDLVPVAMSSTQPLQRTHAQRSEMLLDLDIDPETEAVGEPSGVSQTQLGAASQAAASLASSSSSVWSDVLGADLLGMSDLSLAPASTSLTSLVIAAEASTADTPPLVDPATPSSPMSPSSPASTHTSVAPPLQPIACEAVTSLRKLILAHHLGGGLDVSMSFVHGAPPTTLPGANVVQVHIENKSDITIRRIRVAFPTSLQRTPFHDITSLAPSEVVDLQAEMLLASGPKGPLKVDVTCDKGRFSGSLTLSQCDLVEPRLVTVTAFQSMKAELGFLSETRHSVAQEANRFASLSEVTALARRVVNMFVVSETDTELCLAGCLGQVRVLVTITLQDGALDVAVNSDQPTFASLVLKALKKELSS